MLRERKLELKLLEAIRNYGTNLSRYLSRYLGTLVWGGGLEQSAPRDGGFLMPYFTSTRWRSSGNVISGSIPRK